MSQVAVTYANAKTAMQEVGLPVSGAGLWTNVDVASWATFLANNSYSISGAYKVDKYKAAYGFAYVGEMPAGVTNLVGAENYSATMAGNPLSGAHPQTVTLTTT